MPRQFLSDHGPGALLSDAYLKSVGTRVLQPAIHCGVAALNSRTFDRILCHRHIIGIALVAASLQATSPYTRDRSASRWSFNCQRELWHRRTGSSNSPTECEQRQAHDRVNSFASHVISSSQFEPSGSLQVCHQIRGFNIAPIPRHDNPHEFAILVECPRVSNLPFSPSGNNP
jgi:hypothetical protein